MNESPARLYRYGQDPSPQFVIDVSTPIADLRRQRTATEILGLPLDGPADPNDPESRGLDPDAVHDRAVEDHL